MLDKTASRACFRVPTRFNTLHVFFTHLLIEGLGLERWDGSENPGLHMEGYKNWSLHRLQD